MGSKAFLTGLLEWRICVSKEVQFVGSESKEKKSKTCPSDFECKRCTAKKMLSSFSCFLKHLTQFISLKFVLSLNNKCVGFWVFCLFGFFSSFLCGKLYIPSMQCDFASSNS